MEAPPSDERVKLLMELVAGLVLLFLGLAAALIYLSALAW
jgi:hypothetical protein